MNIKKLSQSAISEMLVSFIFGFVVYAAILQTKAEDSPASGTIVGIAIGFSSVAIIYAFMDTSAAHYNPAITLAAMICMKLDFLQGCVYILFQFIGFILAALMAIACFPFNYEDGMAAIRPIRTSDAVTTPNLFWSEFVLTAILVFVAFSMAINSKRDPDISCYGEEELPDRSIVAPVAIGLTLGFLAFLASTSSGSVFNPGIVFAPMILSNVWTDFWQYWVAQFTGGLLGGLIQTFILFK